MSTGCWPGVDWVLTGCWPGVDWVLTGCWPGVDWVLTGCWPGVDWVLTRCWLGVDVVKFISTYWLCTLMKHYRTSNQPVMLRNRINMINDLWWYLGSIKLFLGFWVFKMFQSNISVYSPPSHFFYKTQKILVWGCWSFPKSPLGLKPGFYTNCLSHQAHFLNDYIFL